MLHSNGKCYMCYLGFRMEMCPSCKQYRHLLNVGACSDCDVKYRTRACKDCGVISPVEKDCRCYRCFVENKKILKRENVENVAV